MKGFRDFLLKGNLITLAIAFVMAAAFGEVVQAFVTIILDLIGKAGGTPNFSSYQPGGVHVGLFITVLIAFIILAAVVYFFVVVPYMRAREKYYPELVAGPDEVTLLTEIRDLMAQQNGRQ